MHMREAIREEVKQVLDAYLTSIPAGNVFKARVYPMDDASLPGVCLYVENETSQLGTTMGSPRTSERILELTLAIYVKAAPDITEALNIIAGDVEVALTQDTTLNGLALDLQVSGWDESLNGDQTDRSQGHKTGVGEITCQIMYDVPETNPNYTP